MENKDKAKTYGYFQIGAALILLLLSLMGCKKSEPIFTIQGVEIDGIILVPDYYDDGFQALINSRANEPLTLWSLQPVNNVIGTSPVSNSILTKQRILKPLASAIIGGTVNGQAITPFTEGSDFNTWSFGSPLNGDWLNNYKTYSDSTISATSLSEMLAIGKIVQATLGIFGTQMYVTMVAAPSPYDSDFKLVHKYGVVLQDEALLTGNIRFRTIENRQYTPAPVSITGGCTPEAEWVHNYNSVPNLVRICDLSDYGLAIEFGFQSGM